MICIKITVENLYLIKKNTDIQLRISSHSNYLGIIRKIINLVMHIMI